jgi:lipopolysaccharide transport system ATP-binding protein
MGRPIIEVENLSKRYRLGAIGATSLKDAFGQWWERRWRRTAAGRPGEFWALRDISFSVNPGEVLGVIGRNGAGKSTLLKILSRITEPTAGRAVLRGRVASLLEVGTGFHPDLTGRENIFINGAILGMTRGEIRRKFDEIVAFSEIEKFIDTPVKHYSSGMYVRLAFAVAAHLEPEILIVDEVLAVGDSQFQKKCLGKINEVTREEGRTVLFVSHNLAAISTLCRSGIYLAEGRIVQQGPTAEILARYNVQSNVISGTCDLAAANVGRRGSGAARFVAARLQDTDGRPLSAAVQGEPFHIELELRVREALPVSIISLTLVDPWGNDLFTTIHYDSLDLREVAGGDYRFTIEFEPNFLARGTFIARLACFGPNFLEYDHVPHAFSMLVAASLSDPDIAMPRPGTVALNLPWRMNYNR